ncbi:hypothetical protein [Symbioplanes lichenis]|uniref:hypothetical protein n=1 Tax=Symbioplanes lichenis TaxID=1629072 RepID=UPI00273894B8|nr:hypothetical protein [Actinoplanes lichenis]
MQVTRRLLAAAAAVLMSVLVSFVIASPARADTDVAHVCGNPSTVYGGVRAALCADITWVTLSSGKRALSAKAEAYCQKASSPFDNRQCEGIVVGADMYRRGPTQSTWTLETHGFNTSCGSLSESSYYPCPYGRLLTYDQGGHGWLDSACVYFRAGARASITLPGGGPTISGYRQYAEWHTPACSA